MDLRSYLAPVRWAPGGMWLLLVPLLLLMGWAKPVQAHAALVSTEPADGAILTEPPQQVIVRFSEPVSVIRAQVLDPAGNDLLDHDAANSEEGALWLDLPPQLAEGTYTVSFRVLSLDGHPVGGSLVFSVGVVSGGTAAETDASTPVAWRWATIASWVAFYLALFSAAGGMLFTALAKPGELSVGPTRRVIAVSAVLGILAAIVALGVQGGLLLGGPLGSLLEVRTWQAGALSTFGHAAVCAIAGLLLILLSVTRPPSTVMTSLGLVGMVLALASFVLTGHVVTAGPWWLTWPLLLIHTSIVAYWVGSLVPLHRALRTPADQAGPLVERFSRLAVVLVPVLIFAGVLIAVLQVGRLEALVSTEYGRVLLVKAVLVSGLMLLAALNRLWLTPALLRGDTGASGPLGTSILAELGLVVAVLAATVALGTTPPPRALAQEQIPDARDTHAHAEHGHAHGRLTLQLEAESVRAELALEPGGRGANTATISLSDAAGDPLDVLEVALRVSNPARGIEWLRRQAVREGFGTWRVTNLVLGVAGEWEIALDVLVSDFKRETAKSLLVLE